MHEYLSTACLHGQHGDRLRECKYCTAPCSCTCGHDAREAPSDIPLVRLAGAISAFTAREGGRLPDDGVQELAHDVKRLICDALEG